MKKVIYVFLVVFPQILFAQNTPEQAIDALLDSTRQSNIKDVTKTNVYFTKAKQLARQEKLEASYYKILKSEVVFNSVLGNNERAMNLADSLIDQNVSKFYKANGYLEKGILLSRTTNLAAAIKNAKAALVIFEELEDQKGATHAFKILGNISYMNNSFKEARHYYKRAINYMLKDSSMEAAGNTYTNLSRTFEPTNEIDSAIYYNNKAKKIALEFNHVIELKFGAFTNDADYQSKIGNHEAALKALEVAKGVADTTAIPSMIGTVFQIRAVIYANMNQFERAAIEAENAYLIYADNGHEAQANQTINLIRKFNAKSGNYKKAYQYLDMYVKNTDSLNQLSYEKSLSDLRFKYETAEKELKIIEQNSEILKKETEKNRVILIAFSLAIILVLLIVVYVQNIKSQNQKIAFLENEKENIALKSLMAGEEKERSRIAKELHDGIGSLLAASKMHASKLELDNAEKKTMLINLLDNASKETRRISHNLLPESLMNKGLDVALHDFIISLNESQLIKTEYESVNLSINLPQSTQLTIYRIIQELLNNIIKHSEATEAFIQLQQHDKKLIITVEDNGNGFSYDNSKNGIGLQNIKSRLSLLNGKMEVDSNVTLGTSVYIEFELEK
ncbi:MAG: hypothetical protein CMC55_00935 [Flavobacteriaceae bacterium]|uniref:sensor histidine kinase n=1 Tax=Bizionia echini TaxID=649333 RepID=UPI000C90E981|nr:hypothetical protein [Flavobacteriaceae bacterium]